MSPAVRRCAATCEDCGRPLRPRGTSPEDHPGTVVAVSSTRCSRCAKAHRHGKPTYRKHPNITIGDPCAECGRPMRPNTYTIAEAPGTVDHFHHGICRTCVRRTERLDLRTRPPRPKPVEPPPAGLESDDPTIRTAAASLDRFMSRRRRGTPTPARSTTP